MLEAITRGDAVEPLVAALKSEEEQKETLAREMEALAAVDKVASLDCDQIKRELQARVADVRALLLAANAPGASDAPKASDTDRHDSSCGER